MINVSGGAASLPQPCLLLFKFLKKGDSGAVKSFCDTEPFISSYRFKRPAFWSVCFLPLVEAGWCCVWGFYTWCIIWFVCFISKASPITQQDGSAASKPLLLVTNHARLSTLLWGCSQAIHFFFFLTRTKHWLGFWCFVSVVSRRSI